MSTGEQLVRFPARGGLAYARGLLRNVAQVPSAPSGTRGDLTAAIESLRRPPRRRGLAVVVSDFLGEPTWEATLRALSGRHELLAVEVLDPRELELPEVGTVVLADPESGRQREVVTTPLLCREFAAAAAAHRERVALALRRAGAAHLQLRTDSDWIADVVRFAAHPQAGLVGRGPVNGVFTAALVARWACSWWRSSRWPTSLLLRRRRRDTLAFTNLELLDKIAPKRPGWYRHIPAAALLVALALLTVALAGPQAEARVPRNRATVVLVIDVSLSMQATDVAPSRLAAAQAAAKSFADQLTPGVNLGLVSFAGTAAVLVSPTTDREPIKRAVDGLKLAESTATGDAILAALQSIETFSQALVGASGEGPPPARIVLMSDGGQTVPGGPGAEDQPRGSFTAARKAAEVHVPVSTISFGTDYGTIELDADKPPVSVAVDDEAMRRIAELSNGQFFTAASETELRQVYAQLGEQIGYEMRKVDTSRPWLAGGALMLVVGRRGHRAGPTAAVTDRGRQRRRRPARAGRCLPPGWHVSAACW